MRVMGSGDAPLKLFTNDWMGIGGGNIGPEIGIGFYVGEVTDEPVLILKSCTRNSGARSRPFTRIPCPRAAVPGTTTTAMPRPT